MANPSLLDAPAAAARQIGRIADALDPRSLIAAPQGVARRLLHLPTRDTRTAPGQKPHASLSPAHKPACQLHRYSPEAIEELAVDPDKDVVARCRRDGMSCWLDIQGLGDPPALRALLDGLGVHPLHVDDVFNCFHRPKLDDGPGHLFAIMKMIRVQEERAEIEVEQVSFFIFDDFLLTIQERPGDVFEPVRARLREGKGRIRRLGPSYLAHALMDAIVDNYYLVVERLGYTLEELERDVLENPEPSHMRRLQRIREEALVVRRALWPAREVLAAAVRSDCSQIHQESREFFSNVLDHVVQVMEAVDSLRDLLGMVLELYMSGVSHRMNEVMKTLTIFATIFLPMSFLAGVYGMNFDVMPELGWRHGYALWWGTAVLLAAGLLLFFRRKRWL